MSIFLKEKPLLYIKKKKKSFNITVTDGNIAAWGKSEALVLLLGLTTLGDILVGNTKNFGITF